jgi:transcriptional regulator GlxA family with amidase domain
MTSISIAAAAAKKRLFAHPAPLHYNGCNTSKGSSKVMTHVCILVPHGSVLLNSIVGLFKIFDLANRYAANGGREAAFELHLVAEASTAQLYGGHVLIKPDLRLAEVAATDLVIIPALAGNIAETLKINSAFIPWIKKQYRGGSEIAGLCTGAFFMADIDLIRERHGSSHWFVDATFRKQYSQIHSVAEKTAIESIHTGSGAWFFFQELVERIVGKNAALACSATFQDPFNRSCQSVVSVSHLQRRRANRIAKKGVSADSNSMQEMTVERFISLFEVIHGNRGSSLSTAALFEETFRTPIGRTHQKDSCTLSDEQDGADSHNTGTFKALVKKIERFQTSYGNG